MAGRILLWTARLGVIACFLEYLIHEVMEYSDDQVVAFTRTQVVPFPKVTICPVAMSGLDQIQPVMQRVAEGSISMEEAFNQTTMLYPRDKKGDTQMNSMEYGWERQTNTPPGNTILGRWDFSYRYHPRPNEQNVKDVNLFVTNRCGTFHPNESMFSPTNTQGHQQLVINLSVNTSSTAPSGGAYFALVHYKSIHDFYLFPVPPRFKAVELKNGIQTSLDIIINGDQRLNRRSAPCEKQEDYDPALCRARCNQRRLMDVLGCRLPSMAGNSYQPRLPPCRFLPQSHRLSGATIDGVQLNTSWIRHIDEWTLYNAADCDCPASCNVETIYMASAPDDRRDISNGVTSLKLSFGYVSRENVEQLNMSIFDLVGNIGGVLGMLLGISVFSGLDMLNWILGRMWQRRCLRNRRPRSWRRTLVTVSHVTIKA